MALKTKPKNIVELPGIEGEGVAPLSIPEIDKLAKQYIHERGKRCDMTPKELKAKKNLIGAIHKHIDAGTLKKDRDGTVVYRYDDQTIILKQGKETIKVKDVSEPEED